jgi:hypothetical protein
LISSNPYWKVKNMGLMRLGLCPEWDPGAVIVKLHMKRNPGGAFSRPSSLLLAMMAIGMNDNFTFLGYLPRKDEERASKTLKKYLSNKINPRFSLKRPIATINYWRTCYKPYIQKRTYASLPISPVTEYIKTKKIAAWKRNY